MVAAGSDKPIAIGGDVADHAQYSQDKLNSMSTEERVQHLIDVVMRNPLHREIHYKVLKYCIERQLLPNVEDFISACPEFKSASQSQYFLLQFLIKGGGIDCFELDELGNVVSEEQKQGLSEDEIDDLVQQFAYRTNAYGLAAIDELSSQTRLSRLFDSEPHYQDTYLEILDFLTKKHDFSDIDNLLRGRAILSYGRAADDRPIQPSVFVDRLEKTGAIYWDKGWCIAEEGKEYLQKFRKGGGA